VRAQLREALSGYEMGKEVRGIGLLNGIEFQSPRKLAMFGQVAVVRLFGHGLLIQMCANNFIVLKALGLAKRVMVR
jgi:acetylornithine/succinyldiaminopimelate/putrescine aminotransferase